MSLELFYLEKKLDSIDVEKEYLKKVQKTAENTYFELRDKSFELDRTIGILECVHNKLNRNSCMMERMRVLLNQKNDLIKEMSEQQMIMDECDDIIYELHSIAKGIIMDQWAIKNCHLLRQ